MFASSFSISFFFFLIVVGLIRVGVVGFVANVVVVVVVVVVVMVRVAVVGAGSMAAWVKGAAA